MLCVWIGQIIPFMFWSSHLPITTSANMPYHSCVLHQWDIKFTSPNWNNTVIDTVQITGGHNTIMELVQSCHMGFGTSRVNAQSNWVFVLFKARKRTNRSEYKYWYFWIVWSTCPMLHMSCILGVLLSDKHKEGVVVAAQSHRTDENTHEVRGKYRSSYLM